MGIMKFFASKLKKVKRKCVGLDEVKVIRMLNNDLRKGICIDVGGYKKANSYLPWEQPRMMLEDSTILNCYVSPDGTWNEMKLYDDTKGLMITRG